MSLVDARPVARGIESLAAALLPPEAGGPPPEEVRAAAAVLLRRMPAVAALGVGAAGLALRATALGRHGRALERLAPAQRAALLDAAARTSAGAVGLDAIKALLLLGWGGADHAAEIGATAVAAPLRRADPLLTVLDGTDVPATVRADAVVVGSGAGGALAARELAAAGRDVVLVEEGERWDTARFRATGPVERFAGLYRDGGGTFALGVPPVALPVGRAVGGSTVVNSGTCYRPPAAVQARWHREHGLALAAPDRLLARLDDVERLIGVAPADAAVLGPNGRLALAGAAALGWQAAPLSRNAPGCRGACQCALGCPNAAKAGVHLNALPEACANGARVLARLTVRRVLHESGRALGVEARNAAGRTIRVLAPLVVVAAGAIGTPPLLRRSGLGSHSRTGHGLAIHPSLGVAGTFAQPVRAWDGILQSVGVEEHHEREGILIEATATPPGMGSMILPGTGPPLLRRLDAAAHVATLGAMVDDSATGRVLGARRPVPVYRLARRDAQRLVRAAGLMAEVLLAAGATEVELGGGAPAVRDPGDLPAALAAVDPRRLHLAAFHPTGTMAAGADSARHPVDERGRLRGVRGVVVADASILPTCPGVNPQVSIMALAAEAAAAACR